MGDSGAQALAALKDALTVSPEFPQRSRDRVDSEAASFSAALSPTIFVEIPWDRDSEGHPSALQAPVPPVSSIFVEIPWETDGDRVCSEDASLTAYPVPRSLWKFRGRHWGTGACSAEGCRLTVPHTLSLDLCGNSVGGTVGRHSAASACAPLSPTEFPSRDRVCSEGASFSAASACAPRRSRDRDA